MYCGERDRGGWGREGTRRFSRSRLRAAGKAKANLMQSSLMQRDGCPKRDDGGETTRPGRERAKSGLRGGGYHGTK